ncbi:GNAT family N-acetyltransferase [Stenoxybacter acetivorans]|uniref:GNAT family N-acetyltransferase n=1 Tax=Stenoxybacter acetivorans TaxID=422441 RepID=UPI00056D781C|nr:GNAT family N-acetyltransferase [Stenoxybacter acetivorans]
MFAEKENKAIDEIVIQGLTGNGKTFRPSDWSERLCGILSSFNQGHRLSYHQWVHPKLVDGIRCVVIDRKLEKINESMFRFLMDFAHDNDLRVLDGLTEKHNSGEPAEAAAIIASETNQTISKAADSESETVQAAETPEEIVSIREIMPENNAQAFAALQSLRPQIRDLNLFQELVTVQRQEGYRLIGVFAAGKQNAVAVCGFRINTKFASGKFLHINDLITTGEATRRGYADTLLEYVKTIAKAESCKSIHADSFVEADRCGAHSLYFRHGFRISAHHFSFSL